MKVGNSRQYEIMVVDDDLVHRKKIERWIVAMGHKCRSVEGSKALEYLSCNPCDLLITDLLMPNQDGMQLLKQVKRLHEDTSVIVATAYNKDCSLNDIIVAGADDFIAKPTTKDVFFATINRVFHIKELKKSYLAELDTKEILIDLLSLSIESKSMEDFLHEFLSCIVTFPWLELQGQGAVFLVDDKDNKMLKLKAHLNLASPLQKKCTEVPLGKCLCGKAALTGKTVFVGNVDKNHNITYEDMPDHGHYCIPIMLEDKKLLGVITLYTKAGVARNETVEKVLGAAAKTLSRIIHSRFTEAQIIQQEQRFRTMTDSVVDAIIMMDNYGLISSWNPAAERIFGYLPEEALGENLHEMIVPPEYRNEYLPALAEFFKCGQGNAIGKTVELFGLHKDGTKIPIELSLSVLQINDTWQSVGIVRDISTRKALERERDELGKQLQQAHKMEAIGTLAGGIAHDFNNILGSIIGSADMAMDEVPPESMIHKDLMRILTAGNRAKDLVAQILTFSRQKKEYFSPVNIEPVIKEALSQLQSSAPPNIKIHQHIEENTNPVLADSTQILQIVKNLGVNAISAMQDKGGVLTITLQQVAIDYQTADTSLDLQDAPWLKLTISDTGSGMKNAVLNRMFEPFFSTKSQGEGAGMGLSVVHGIIAEHNGKINVHSTPGVGSVFNIYLPVHDDQQK